MNAPTFNPTLRAELARLDLEQMLKLLGEIVEPSIYSPFTAEDDVFTDALEPVREAYCNAYRELAYVAAGDHLRGAA